MWNASSTRKQSSWPHSPRLSGKTERPNPGGKGRYCPVGSNGVYWMCPSVPRKDIRPRLITGIMWQGEILKFPPPALLEEGTNGKFMVTSVARTPK